MKRERTKDNNGRRKNKMEKIQGKVKVKWKKREKNIE